MLAQVQCVPDDKTAAGPAVNQVRGRNFEGGADPHP